MKIPKVITYKQEVTGSSPVPPTNLNSFSSTYPLFLPDFGKSTPYENLTPKNMNINGLLKILIFGLFVLIGFAPMIWLFWIR